MRLYDIKEEYLKFKEMTENGEIPPEASGTRWRVSRASLRKRRTISPVS